jgi:hypothetical protein
MTIPDYASFLCGIIKEYQRSAKALHGALETDDWQVKPQYRRAKASITEMVNSTRENPLIAAFEWWQERDAHITSEVQRHRLLKMLLGCLDE